MTITINGAIRRRAEPVTRVRLAWHRGRRLLFLIAALSCLAPAAVTAQQSVATDRSPVSLSIDAAPSFGIGYLRWSIAGTYDGSYGGTGNTYVNILSELTWWARLSAGIDARLRLTTPLFLYEFDLSGAYIFWGLNRDSDYRASDRQYEFMRSRNQTDGFSADASFGMAYELPPRNDRVYFALGPGIYGSTEYYSIHDGTQYQINLDGTTAATFANDGLSAWYLATWYGGWGGFTLYSDAAAVPNPRPGFDLALRAGYVRYYGAANWVKRTDFQHPISFEQIANGFRTSLDAGITFPSTARTSFRLGTHGEFMITAPGVDLLHFSGGTTFSSRFNQALSYDIAVTLGIHYQ